MYPTKIEIIFIQGGQESIIIHKSKVAIKSLIEKDASQTNLNHSTAYH